MDRGKILGYTAVGTVTALILYFTAAIMLALYS